MSSRNVVWTLALVCVLASIVQIVIHMVVPFWVVVCMVLAGMIFTATSEVYGLYVFYALWGFFITYTGDSAGLVRIYHDFVVFFKSFTKVKY
jgi:Ni,Fe-hydrogenase I cytochrome b subunit